MSATNPSRTFQAFMEAQRSSLIERIGSTMAIEIEPMRLMPTDELRATAEGLVEVFLRALVRFDRASIATWARARVQVRVAQGFTLDHMITALSIFRRHFVEAARTAIDERIEGAWEGLNTLLDVGQELTKAFMTSFKENIDEAHKAQLASEKRYRDLSRSTPAMMHSIDSQGRIITVSDQWLESMGYTREEVVGRKSSEFLTEESRRYAAEVVLPEFFRTGRCRDVHYQFVKKSGKVIDIRLDGILLRDEASGEPFSLAILTDVTERLKAERALRESEERHRMLLECVPIGIMVQTGNIIRYMNPAGAAILGAKSPDEFIGLPALDLIHPDDLHLVRERIRFISESQMDAPLATLRWLRRDKSVVDVEVISTWIQYEGERGPQVAFQDITERKRGEEALRQAALQKEIIHAHEEALRALSTPLIPVSRGVLVMPLVGTISESRAAQILEVLLEGVNAHRASIAILDVTGVPEADTSVANALLRAASAVRLLGAEMILTGIRAPVARALVEIGGDLSSIVTRGTLEDGISYSTEKARARGR